MGLIGGRKKNKLERYLEGGKAGEGPWLPDDAGIRKL